MPPRSFADSFRVHTVRGRPVVLQSELSRIFAVPLPRLLSLVKDFPGDFCFPLDDWEIPIFSDEPMTTRRRPCAFTDRGVLAVACALGTHQAISTGVATVHEMMRRYDSSGHASAPALRVPQPYTA